MRSSMKPALYRLYPTNADLFTECIPNHETKQTSKFKSDPSSNCFTIEFIFLLSYCYLYLILHKVWSVLGIDLLCVQYLFKTLICSSVRMNKSH